MSLQMLIIVSTHQVDVTGKDAEVFLERLLVADLRKLQLGEGRFMHFTCCACNMYMHVP